MAMGTGDVVPHEPTLSAVTARVSSGVSMRAQQVWLNIASWMAASGYTGPRAQAVADEVERRMHVMRCAYEDALDSVWHDMKAGREMHAD